MSYHDAYKQQLGGFGGRGRWRTSNNRAERTPLEGRKPELGQHGYAGIATPGRAGRLFNA
ncbi:MAG: hypothetical protein PHO08_20665 [Methylococcales bacterium]|nr:hypothetical protein [Methylococcales bacterium]